MHLHNVHATAKVLNCVMGLVHCHDNFWVDDGFGNMVDVDAAAMYASIEESISAVIENSERNRRV